LSDDWTIRTESLGKTYRSGGSEIVVFEDLSLTIPSGERVAVVGESGSGKSTLLHLLGGLDRPTAGTIWYGTCNVNSLSGQALADFRNRQIGFVWQNASLLPEFTTIENVMMPLLIRGTTPSQAVEVGHGLLKEVGLADRAHHRTGELSGGEQQRAAVARAFAGGPRVILADEPTGSLDFGTGEEIIGLLMDLHERYGLTSVFVTHNLSFAKRCDRVLELKKGALYPLSHAEQEFSDVARDATRLDGGTYV
jgi:lipoprotein-releasing system ATP-binding protein